jgi:hypothetical protein
MKKIFLILTITATVIACKKENNSPTSSTSSSTNNNSNTKPLPEEYIIFSDGTKTDTLQANGGGMGMMGTVSTQLSVSGGVNIHNQLNTSVRIVGLFPSDSTSLGNFPIGTYGTSSYDNQSSVFVLYDIFHQDKVKNGTICLKIQDNPYSSSPSQPFVSYIDDQSATNSYHKITKITKLNSIWNQAWNIKSAVYLFEGEFKIPVKELSGTQTKIVQGKYKWKCKSSI